MKSRTTQHQWFKFVAIVGHTTFLYGQKRNDRFALNSSRRGKNLKRGVNGHCFGQSLSGKQIMSDAYNDVSEIVSSLAYVPEYETEYPIKWDILSERIGDFTSVRVQACVQQDEPISLRKKRDLAL